jgi:hypothetical protein
VPPLVAVINWFCFVDSFSFKKGRQTQGSRRGEKSYALAALNIECTRKSARNSAPQGQLSN